MISIVTPVYNNPKQIAKLLESLRADKQRYPDLEVIAVDDGSATGSVKDVVESSGIARYVRLDKNSGPAKARNEGARLSKGDIVLFVDSDVIFYPDTFSKIKQRFEREPLLGVLCGEYNYEPENKSFSTKFKAIMAQSWIPRDDKITVFVARLGAIKKSIFNDLGGFDDTIKTASSEEWEFGRRLIAAGITINYDSTIMVRHHFPLFRRQVGLFFHRSYMWIGVFRKYGKFDNTCTTPLAATTQIVGVLSMLMFALSIFFANLISAALILMMLFVVMNMRFFKLAALREGILFALFSLPLMLILSCAIVAGSTWGIIHHYLFSNRIGSAT